MTSHQKQKRFEKVWNGRYALPVMLVTMLTLTGCGTFQTTPPVAIQYKTQIITIPEQMLQIPPPLPITTAIGMNDKDAAEWLLKYAERAQKIENQLIAIKNYVQGKKDALAKP